VTGWNTNTSALSILGDQRVDLSLWDAGIQLYANPYYVTDSTLTEHPEQVAAMIRAISKGWGYAYENRKEAVEILLKRYPNMDLQNELDTVDLLMDYSFNPNTAAKGWGTMTAENWQAQIDIYAQLGQFEGTVPAVADVMTLSVLDATAGARPTYG
jgi:NitT/TauT family transport system substrate-binding protein